MLKVECPKNSWYKEFSYGILTGGVFDGVAGFKLVLSGEECSVSTPLAFLQSLLAAISTMPHGSHDVFRISGTISGSSQNAIMLRTLLYALRPYGFNLQLVLHDTMIEDIPLNLFSWIIYETNTGFVPYPANEIWFKPPEETPLKTCRSPSSLIFWPKPLSSLADDSRRRRFSSSSARETSTGLCLGRKKGKNI